MKKEYNITKGKVVIIFNNYLLNISNEQVKPLNFHMLISFLPNINMSEKECFDYTNENIIEIKKWVKNVLIENTSIYELYDSNFNTKFYGCSLGKSKMNANLLVIDSWMRVNCNLKEHLS